MSAFPYCRIIVIGTTGSGKSTLSEKLAEKLQLDLIELDAIHWQPNWTSLPEAEFRARVDESTRTPRWVISGNYNVVRDISWPRAQAVIWLDYSLWTIFWQLTFRTFRRWWHKELLWGTNRESLWNHFKLWSDESLWHWLFKTYWRRKREIPLLFELPQHSHLEIFRFETPQQTATWLASL